MAFYLGSYLTNILDNIIISRNLNIENLYLCGQLSYFSDEINTIGDYAFYSCSVLTEVSLSQVVTIGKSAFYNCSALTEVNLPQVISIGSNAFGECRSLINVNCPKLLSIPGGCSLRMAGSVLTTLSRYGAFAYCSSLQTISVPLVSFIGPTAFAYCSYLTSFIGPQVLTVGGNYIVSYFTSGSRTFSATLRGGAFERCYELSMVSLPKVSQISTYAFVSCYNLLSLYLLGSSIPTLPSTAFYATPISTYTTSTSGVYGSIFVPASLYSDYLVASGWSVYSSRIVSV